MHAMSMVSFSKKIVSHPVFQKTIVGLIIFSSILLGLETNSDLMNLYGPQLKLLDKIVVSIFALEILLKIISFGKKPWKFFADSWNLFDFVIVAISLIPSGSSAMAVFRLFRVFRVLRLITAIPKLQIIIGALFKSIPSMGYVVMILVIHFYMFGVMGVFLFGQNDPLHFGSLSKAILTLFQIMTLEGWADIMKIQIQGCASFGYQGLESLCTNSLAQPIFGATYFVIFIILGTMIILNLLIGVVVNSMSEAHQETHKGDDNDIFVAVKHIQQDLELIKKKLDK